MTHIRSNCRAGALAGLMAAAAIALVETGLSIADIFSSNIPGALLAPVFFFLTLAPPLMLAGVFFGIWLGITLGKSAPELVSGLRASWSRQGPHSHSWFISSLRILALAGLAVGLPAAVQLTLAGKFNNKTLSALLTAVVALGLFTLVAGPLWGLLGTLGRSLDSLRDPWNRRLGGRRLFAGVALLLLLGLSGAGFIFRDTIEAIGPTTILWLVLVPLLFLASWLPALSPRLLLGRPGPLFLSLVVPLALLGAVGMGELRFLRLAALNTEGPAIELVDLYKGFSDLDHDGASSLFGEGDCSPLDPDVGPYSMEIPGNGIDDNCLGGDADPDGELDNPKSFADLPEGFPDKPNLVLITVDALRADHVGAFGYERDTTPRLDELAESAVLFEKAYSQGTGTVSSMPSLFTSLYTYQIAYEDEKSPQTISPDNTTLAERLQAQGYATCGVSTIRYTSKQRWGLTQGFDSIDLSMTSPDPAYYVTSPQVLEKAVECMERYRDRPYFLWVHFYDTHSSYLEHPEIEAFGDEKIDLYDGEILYTDSYIGKLMDRIRQEDREGNRRFFIVLTADHGEGFSSDRGKATHAYGLFGELLHVPMMIWAPGLKHRLVKTPVGNIDITPTLLNAAGLKESGLMGHSLIPYLYEGYEDPERFIFSEKTFKNAKSGTRKVHKSATGLKWKMIYLFTEGKEKLFDLENDPKEMTDVAPEYPAVADDLRQQVLEFMEHTSSFLYSSKVKPFLVDKLPEGVREVEVSFGDGAVTCIGYKAAYVGKKSGKKRVVLDLYFSADSDRRKPISLSASLRDKKGRPAATRSATPLSGILPLNQWPEEGIVHQQMELLVPAKTRLGALALWLSWGKGKDSLEPDGKSVNKYARIGSLKAAMKN